MADRLSVLKYYLYYKYKKRFSDRSALEQWQVEKNQEASGVCRGSFPAFTRE